MSKYGKINVNVSTFFTSNQINDFAEKAGISYDKAESIAKNVVYRKLYQKARNADPKVKAKRRVENKKRNALASAFNKFAR
jgi:hypothetical protein